MNQGTKIQGGRTTRLSALMLGFFAFALLLVSAFPTAASAATIGKPVSNLGLIGHWSLDEGSGTKAHDLSGRGNTGTLANGPTWTNGKRGKALSFSSASSQYVSVGTNLLSGNDPFTIAAWINPADLTTTWKTIFAENCSGPDLTLNQGTITAGRNCGQGNSFNLTHSLTAGEANTWIFVVMTFDGASTRLFKNGTLVSGPVAGTYLAGGHGAAYIASYSAGAEPFNGKIDDVRLYGRALSASEIVSLYTSGQSSYGAATKTGLVGYWSMNEGSGTKAHDQSGNGNTGTWNGTPAWVNGKKGKAAQFNLTNFIDAGSASNLNITGSFTVSAWIKFTSTAGYGFIVSKSVGGANGYELFQTLGSGAIRFSACNASGVCSTPYFDFTTASSLNDGTWHQVTAVYDKSGTKAYIYVDGALNASSPNDPSADVQIAASNLLIGGRGTGSPAFDGSIDDVRLYNRALSATEVSSLYRSTETVINKSQNDRLTDGLVGYWTFNGPDLIDTVADVSGQGNHGYFIGGATSTAKTIGKVGQALDFDGSSTFVRIGSPYYQFNREITVSAWVKFDNWNYVLSQGVYDVDTMDANVWLWHAVNNGIIWYVNDNGTWRELYLTGLETGKWYHIATVADSVSTRTYLDGSLNGTGQGVATQIKNVPTSEIGTNDIRYGSSRAPHDGKLDEIRIYNRALSADEIKHLYNMGR